MDDFERKYWERHKELVDRLIALPIGEKTKLNDREYGVIIGSLKVGISHKQSISDLCLFEHLPDGNIMFTKLAA